MRKFIFFILAATTFAIVIYNPQNEAFRLFRTNRIIS